MSSAHPDFEKTQAARPDWRQGAEIVYTKSPNPTWKYGDGANDNGESLKKNHVEIDPNAEGRPAVSNYKLLISGMVPRPIALVSTRSADGKSTNLAPFSYSQVAKDTLKNLAETKECVVNIISEHFIEAANSTCINAPYGVSEWETSGLHQAPSAVVKAARVKESVLSIEAKLVEIKEFESRATPGKKSGCMAMVEGVRFWVRDDAINEERSAIDLNVLKPVSRLGGITYGRTTEVIEIPRPQY
ncbi:hypothetical protein N7522_009578 [Penicillium canescens]|uniref:uncharacterized protein n=1 Tax=Penicillium canescens TaxID=5083 RepID=UPI0026DF6319|nr:uncharacterized protein N7446_001454 [Penicillium canescens]KAJ5997918.1 hypothetical protein N7522_009578 [Penicillium canescens]KAJ6073677.1 hypothetical protein N7446_001454 [Penicillium canescens]KAJ6177395.1 hypothetical protein N7485_004309 [Penicillium canescens]